MKFINKLIPAFLKKIDQKLLINNPILWVLKVHYLLFWQACFSIFSLLLCYLIPQSLGNYPETAFTIAVICIANLLIYLVWLFASNQFDIRTRSISKPKGFEHFRVASNLLAAILIIVNLFAGFYIIEKNTTKIVAPLSYEEWLEIENTVDDLSNRDVSYINGYYTHFVYDSTYNTRYEEKVYLNTDSILAHCKRVGELNAIYGDGNKYTGEEVYKMLKDSSTYDPYNEYWSGYNFLDTLNFNTRELGDAFDEINDFGATVFKMIPPLFVIAALIIIVLLLLIYNFKYFGIYQVITAILSPTLLFLILLALAFVLDEFINIDFDNNLALYGILLAGVAASIYIRAFKYNFSSKKRIVIVQTLTFLVPFVLIAFYAEVIDNYYKCAPYITDEGLETFYSSHTNNHNPNYETCRAKQRLFEFSWLIGLSLLSLFVFLPLKLKALYRLYYLPQIK